MRGLIRRNAEMADPGIIRRTLDETLGGHGEETNPHSPAQECDGCWPCVACARSAVRAGAHPLYDPAHNLKQAAWQRHSLTALRFGPLLNGPSDDQPDPCPQGQCGRRRKISRFTTLDAKAIAQGSGKAFTTNQAVV